MRAKTIVLLACLACATATCDQSDFMTRKPEIGKSDSGQLRVGVHPDVVTLAIAELVPAFEAYVGPPGFSPPFFVVEDARHAPPPPPPLPPDFDALKITSPKMFSRVAPNTPFTVPPHLDAALRRAGEWTRQHAVGTDHSDRRWTEDVAPGQLILVLTDVRDCDDRECTTLWNTSSADRGPGLTTWRVRAVAVTGGWALVEPPGVVIVS